MTGHKLRLVREFRNYSQEYIAARLGITQNAYSRIENGLTKITAERLKQLADILSVSLNELFSDKEPEIRFNGEQAVMPAAPSSENLIETSRLLYEQIIGAKDEKINYLEKELKLLREEKERMIELIEKLTVSRLFQEKMAN
jgi:transcriptional regulator with XRE-family HTH domain